MVHIISSPKAPVRRSRLGETLISFKDIGRVQLVCELIGPDNSCHVTSYQSHE